MYFVHFFSTFLVQLALCVICWGDSSTDSRVEPWTRTFRVKDSAVANLAHLVPAKLGANGPFQTADLCRKGTEYDGIYFYSGKLLHFAFPFTDRQNDMTVFTAQCVPIGPNMICNLHQFTEFTFMISEIYIQHLFRACHLRWQEQDLRKDLQVLATEVSLTGTIFLLSCIGCLGLKFVSVSM